MGEQTGDGVTKHDKTENSTKAHGMKTLRMFLFLPGLAAIGWGIWLITEFALPINPQSFLTTGWLLGGPLVHDALIAPLVGATGLLLSKIASKSWRAPLIVGAALSGML